MNQNMTTEPTKLWNRQYILVLLLNTLNAFSFYMVVTILSKYLVSIGISIATAGVIVGLFSITSLCCRPFSGLLADRLSNVTLLKWSNILMGIGLLGFAFVTNPVLFSASLTELDLHSAELVRSLLPRSIFQKTKWEKE